MIFEKLGYSFDIDSQESNIFNGISIDRIEGEFLLRIYSGGKASFESLLNERQLLYRISDYYNEIMRDIRSLEVNNQITKFEWRVVNTIRKIKKFHYGRTIKLKKRD